MTNPLANKKAAATGSAAPTRHWDAVILGAGAAGLMTAITAAKRGRHVLVLDHAKRAAEKIRISGGGRCNFTNLGTSEKNFLSDNPRFCISALRGYSPGDFINWIESHKIAWHEKTLGQLFCDDSAQNIIDMLLGELHQAGGCLQLDTHIRSVERKGDTFHIATDKGCEITRSLVVATGGKSIPKIGATGLGYQLAEQFGLPVLPTRAALVPFTFADQQKAWSAPLAGLSVDAEVRCGKTAFREGLLFTHRGLSGPSILQISSYWREGKPVFVNLAPDDDCLHGLLTMRQKNPKQDIATALSSLLPKRLARAICEREGLSGQIAQHGDRTLRKLDNMVHRWEVTPVGTEGYRTAEVTLGGVDTRALSSRTMQANDVPGLYFVGEVLDVTGQLGGYNFQWAWASGYAAGKDL